MKKSVKYRSAIKKLFYYFSLLLGSLVSFLVYSQTFKLDPCDRIRALIPFLVIFFALPSLFIFIFFFAKELAKNFFWHTLVNQLQVLKMWFLHLMATNLALLILIFLALNSLYYGLMRWYSEAADQDQRVLQGSLEEYYETHNSYPATLSELSLQNSSFVLNPSVFFSYKPKLDPNTQRFESAEFGAVGNSTKIYSENSTEKPLKESVNPKCGW